MKGYKGMDGMTEHIDDRLVNSMRNAPDGDFGGQLNGFTKLLTKMPGAAVSSDCVKNIVSELAALLPGILPHTLQNFPLIVIVELG